MPHECTSCGRAFEDGAKEMLSGCPSCDGNRFQFVPEARAASSESSESDLIEAETDPSYDPRDSMWDEMEDRAQSAARSGMVDPDSLPDHASPDVSEEPEEPDEDQPAPDLEELREELEDQFGSIKIVDKGEYELNLMELFERRECIIELQENGRYAIQVPEAMASTGGSAGDVPNR